jgi:hypothetical protein
MTAIAVDIRAPLLVLVGSFNPAIFAPAWLATNVFGVVEGTELSVLEALIELDPQTLLQLSFVNGVAINVAPNRMDIFVIDSSDETLKAAEGALIKVFELLPHTPVQALGCNYRCVDADPSPDVIDLFDSNEGVEGKYAVRSRQYTVQIELDGALLNFSRATFNNEVHFSFNYHRNLKSVDEIASIIPGLIKADLEHGAALLQSLYGYDERSTLEYAANFSQGELAHAAEITD